MADRFIKFRFYLSTLAVFSTFTAITIKQAVERGPSTREVILDMELGTRSCHSENEFSSGLRSVA